MDNVFIPNEYSDFTPNLVLKSFNASHRDRVNFSSTHYSNYDKLSSNPVSDFQTSRKQSVVERLINKFKSK